MMRERKNYSISIGNGLYRLSMLLIGMIVLSAVSACSPPAPQGINDPFEPVNRGIHSFNKRLDSLALRPVARGYGAVVPSPVRTGVSNFSNNLDLPGMVLNNLLQGDIVSAGKNTLRFALNTTLGVGGLLDPAGDSGLYAEETDFGVTLHRWGVREGPYVELPVLGPSTARDAAGTVVDFALNPLGPVLSSEARIAVNGAQAGDVLNERHNFDDTISGVLYDSADSYRQARLLYLQARRFELGQDSNSTASEVADPYADAGSEALAADPYADPYAE